VRRSDLLAKSGVSVNIDVGSDGLFAGKPAPTVDFWRTHFLCSLKIPVGASLLAMAVYQTCKYSRANQQARSINIGAISIAVGVPWRV